jgi:ubiquinone biosynthesis protein
MVEILDKYYGVPIGLVNMSLAFNDVMRVARSHRVIFPRDLVMLGRSLTMVTSLARQIYPGFDFAAVMKPYATQLLKEKLSPVRAAKNSVSVMWQISNLLRHVPRDLRQLSRRLLGGRLQFILRVPQLEGLVGELDRATNRLAFSIIVGSVVIGSSFLIHAKIRPFFTDLPGIGRFMGGIVPELSLLGTIGYLIAGCMGMLLAWAIWRSGKL